MNTKPLRTAGRRLAFWTVLATLLLFVGTSGRVDAHATLLRTDPADGAMLATAPEAVHLWFDEAVAANLSMIRLLDATGKDRGVVQVTSVSDDPTGLVVQLPTLTPGMYTLLYQVLAQSDGHYAQGMTIFGTEGGNLGGQLTSTVSARALGAGDEPTFAWPEAALRWLHLMLLLISIGAVGSGQWLFGDRGGKRFVVAHFPRLGRRHALALAWWATLLLIPVGLTRWSWQLWTLYQRVGVNQELVALAQGLLVENRWGLLWLAQQVLLLLLCWALAQTRRREVHTRQPIRSPGWLGINSLLLLLLLTQSLSSHAASVANARALAVTVDFVHLVAAGLWVGGLVTLAAFLGLLLRSKHRRRHSRLWRVLVDDGWRRFGAMAATSVLLLFATGLYSMGQQVAAPDALLMTPYGRFLLAKIVLVLGAGTLGLLNTLRFHPNRAPAWLQRLPRPLTRASTWVQGQEMATPGHAAPLILGEAALLLCGVLLLTAVVTANAAPRGASYTVDPATVPSALTRPVDDLLVTLTVKPNRPGQNVLNIFAASTERPEPAPIMRVLVRYHPIGQPSALTSVTTEAIAPGRYLLAGPIFSFAGPWSVDVVVRRQGLEDSIAHFEWLTPPIGELTPVVLSKYPWRTMLTALALLLLLLLTGIFSGYRPLRYYKALAPQPQYSAAVSKVAHLPYVSSLPDKRID